MDDVLFFDTAISKILNLTPPWLCSVVDTTEAYA